MEKLKMSEFEAETRAEYLAYFYIIGKLSADAMYHTDKKYMEYARKLLEIAEKQKQRELERLRLEYDIEG